MMKILIAKPDGWTCTFGECRPGFFMMVPAPEASQSIEGVFLKTEYSSNEEPDKFDAYCDSGEYFWGGMPDCNVKERNALMVQPVIMVWEKVEGWLP